MIVETLVIASCLGKYECSKVTQAYYLSKPELRSWVKTVKEKYNDGVKNEPFLQAAVPTVLGSIFLISGGNPRIRITEHISLKLSKDQTDIRLTYVF